MGLFSGLEGHFRGQNRHVPSPVGVLYIKFTAGAVTEFLLLSFKEKGDD
jgi:hypothetical protein